MHMINAYILISMEPGNSDKAIAEMRKIEDVAKISIVAGDYDIVVRVQVKSLEGLLKVTDKLHMIKGIKKTTTQVIEKEITL
jgi:DNA-binding Lrp family transcriptional regulator